jgi:hypothetical protein
VFLYSFLISPQLVWFPLPFPDVHSLPSAKR